MVENSKIKLVQVADTIQRNEEELTALTQELSQDYLTRAHAFAYIIQQNPDVLDSLEELKQIKNLLNVDELHVINEKGILIAGTIPKYYGMDFASTDQTAEFLKILESPQESLVQDIRPNGAEQKVFQYVGVARKDQPGIVQIGLAPTRLLEARKKNELSYIFSRVPLDAGSSLFAIDSISHKVLAHSDPQYIGIRIEELGIPFDQLHTLKNGGFCRFQNQRKYYVTMEYKNVILGFGQEEKVLYADRSRDLFFISAYTLLTFLVVAAAIDRLLKWQIVDGVHQIMGDLRLITDGDLQTVVQVDSNPEFQQLSAGINHMVEGIVSASGRVAKVIEMVDMSIGVFEYNCDSNRVMVSSRLRLVMGWTEEEAAALYQDKEQFIQRLTSLSASWEPEEEDVYRVSQEPEKWVRIRIAEDQGGTFGIAADVTAEILEKRAIRHERDYDPLTGLCRLARFRKYVEMLLKEPQRLETAAMLMLDLDHFKGINDRYGHDWGDRYLEFTSQFLKRFNGERGLVARRSGDEFCIFLFGYRSRQELETAVNSLYQWISEEQIVFPDGKQAVLQISSGLAWYDEGMDDYCRLMQAADAALYHSKNHGRGKLSQYQKGQEISSFLCKEEEEFFPC